jgi:hypothetical protein
MAILDRELALEGLIASAPLVRIAREIGVSPDTRSGLERAARVAVDGLGKHIDPGILNVVALNLRGCPPLRPARATRIGGRAAPGPISGIASIGKESAQDRGGRPEIDRLSQCWASGLRGASSCPRQARDQGMSPSPYRAAFSPSSAFIQRLPAICIQRIAQGGSGERGSEMNVLKERSDRNLGNTIARLGRRSLLAAALATVGVLTAAPVAQAVTVPYHQSGGSTCYSTQRMIITSVPKQMVSGQAQQPSRVSTGARLCIDTTAPRTVG